MIPEASGKGMRIKARCHNASAEAIHAKHVPIMFRRTFDNANIVKKVTIAPIISKDMYQSGPFISTGKKVSGRIHERNVIHDTSLNQFSEDVPYSAQDTRKADKSATQYAGAIRRVLSWKSFHAEGPGVSARIDGQNFSEIPAAVNMKKKLTTTVVVSVNWYRSQLHFERFSILRCWFKW